MDVLRVLMSVLKRYFCRVETAHLRVLIKSFGFNTAVLKRLKRSFQDAKSLQNASERLIEQVSPVSRQPLLERPESPFSVLKQVHFRNGLET